jgi:hypothetical protein
MDEKYRRFLLENGYSNIIEINETQWAAIQNFAFTTAIIVGTIGNHAGYEDRWCYAHEADAVEALLTWAGTGKVEGEPKGWHRHPGSGRRRPDGDEKLEYIRP